MTKNEYEKHKKDYENRQLSGGAFILLTYCYVDALENKTCENCIYCYDKKEIAFCIHDDNTQEIYNSKMMQITLDFGCNKWERK